MRRYRCDLCSWRGKPHAYIEDVVNVTHYDEALQHVADEHPERMLSPPLTVEVWLGK